MMENAETIRARVELLGRMLDHLVEIKECDTELYARVESKYEDSILDIMSYWIDETHRGEE